EAGGTGPYCFFQSKRRLSEMPSSALISRADLPLLNHIATVSCLNTGSNLRRGLISKALAAVSLTSFITRAFYFSPLAGVRQIEATEWRLAGPSGSCGEPGQARSGASGSCRDCYDWYKNFRCY